MILLKYTVFRYVCWRWGYRWRLTAWNLHPSRRLTFCPLKSVFRKRRHRCDSLEQFPEYSRHSINVYWMEEDSAARLFLPDHALGNKQGTERGPLPWGAADLSARPPLPPSCVARSSQDTRCPLVSWRVI